MKITTEQARQIIEYEDANQDVFTVWQMSALREYFIQQEKQEELLGLYREQKRVASSHRLLSTTPYYELEDKIEALESKLKGE